MSPGPSGWSGAALCLAAIYLPSLLLLVGVLPFWDGLRTRIDVRAAMGGVNAAVVGLLLAALYAPVWTSAIHASIDVAIELVAFALLVFWRWPPWLVVALGALAAASTVNRPAVLQAGTHLDEGLALSDGASSNTVIAHFEFRARGG